jgi:hypothetical protein
MTAVDDFRAGALARDLDAVMATFAPDARFYSPVKFRPIDGAPAIRVLLGVILQTFQDFRYVGALAGEVDRFAFAADEAAADAEVLVFRARVGDAEIHGIDMFHLGESGLIDELTVMVRPQSALLTLSAAVLEGLQAATH